MLPNPLHPAVVHFPIVLVVVLPLVAVAALVAIRRGAGIRAAWAPVTVVALALAGSSWLALETGEHEEEAVEEVVPENAIHEHEEAAEIFLPFGVAVLLSAALGFVPGRAGHAFRLATPAVAALALYFGVQVGHTGGALVYEHDAPAAYATSDTSVRALPTRGDDDDHDRREDGH